MFYRIVSKFGPADGARWHGYLKWRRLSHLTRFDSVDGILRPSLFVPKSEDDWRYCVNADFKTDLITDLGYARSILSCFENAEIVGVDCDVESDYVPAANFLGYDIIDGDCYVSVLTNWGTDEENLMTSAVSENGLILDLKKAIEIRDKLRSLFSEDGHAADCTVWGIYSCAAQ